MAKRIICTLRTRLNAFLAERSGNVAIIFALAIIPVIGLVGVAVDYSRANSARTAMQAAIDSVALMLSKDAGKVTNAQLQQKANDYFKALFNRPEVNSIAIESSFNDAQTGNFSLKVNVTGKIDTTIARVLGQDHIDLSVNSRVDWGTKKLELALALDNTGSMAWSNKMTELKKATKDLLKVLKNAAIQTDDVKVAIVPFNTTVNLGTSHKDETWLDWTTASCPGSGWGSGAGNCGVNAKKNHWTGCVEDRDQDYDVQDTPPNTSITSTLFPATDCTGSLTSLIPLTTDWNALNSKVDAMQPNGRTNVTIGMVWAWHALTTNVPLTEGTAPAPDREKVIIALTDGDNTQNRWTTSQLQIDDRTKKVCDNIKASNIKVYVIRVIEGNAALLKSCATNPDYYYDVQQASQLSAVFTNIAENLASLHIAQ